jgi:hypothetical protein
MTRFWAIGVVLIIALTATLGRGGDKAKDFQAKGVLTKDDPKDQGRGGPSQTHTVAMKAGNVYTIDMVKTELDSGLDPYLRLLDPKGIQLEEDDDSGGELNARIIFNCTKDGNYKIVATSFGPDMKGAYTLTVKTTGGIPIPSSAHKQMIGKPAPEIVGDFAINGKVAKLANLKGKVVLLYFWEVRSSASVAYLPRLAEWNKTHKKDGLRIVGATFYASEINQKLGFDEEEGTITTVKKADRKSDQALLRAFAKFHKIDHLLMALTKQEALAANDAYVVNGLPQIVLIDRQGMVRLIDVGGEKGSANVEIELKKLLAEK